MVKTLPCPQKFISLQGAVACFSLHAKQGRIVQFLQYCMGSPDFPKLADIARQAVGVSTAPWSHERTQWTVSQGERNSPHLCSSSLWGLV